MFQNFFYVLDSASSDLNVNMKNYTSQYPVTSIANYAPRLSNEPHQSTGSRKGYFEWNYNRSVGPIKTGKHLNDSQKFWKPEESFPIKPNRNNATLPSIH